MCNLLNLTLQYFNIAHFILMSFVPLLIIVLYFSFRHTSEKTKFWVILIVCIVNFIMYFSYKIVYCIATPEINIWNELPIHLCNLNLFFMPIALIYKNRYFFGYFYFVGMIASLSGIVFFGSVFLGYNAFSYVVLIYFIYHALLIVVSLLIIVFGFYKPRFNDILVALIMLAILAISLHIINIVFRVTNICETANYLVTFPQENNIGTDFLYNLIPVPLLYLLPMFAIIFASDLLLLSIYRMIAQKKFSKRLFSMNVNENEQLDENNFENKNCKKTHDSDISDSSKNEQAD